jgi:hypothetical protein
MRTISKLVGRPVRDSEAGMTTSEYAVGTIATCGAGGLLYQLVTSEWFGNLIQSILEQALTVVQ